MDTFFVRHTSKLDIDYSTLKKMYDNDIFGIHYPHTKTGLLNEEDFTSLDPDDYVRAAKSAVKRLNEISLHGGYVFAIYENIDCCKVGLVVPGTPVEIFNGFWGNKNNDLGRLAALKTIKFSKVKTLDPTKSVFLKAIQPRQGTICRWRNVGNKIENLVNNTLFHKELSSLTPDQQEVLCSEFLRTQVAETEGLPRINSMLTPIGRTMIDVDIVGLSSKNQKVFAQVTFGNNHKWKFEKLRKYNQHQDSQTIMFCNCTEVSEKNGILIYPIKKVFDLYCNKTEEGKFWLENLA